MGLVGFMETRLYFVFKMGRSYGKIFPCFYFGSFFSICLVLLGEFFLVGGDMG